TRRCGRGESGHSEAEHLGRIRGAHQEIMGLPVERALADDLAGVVDVAGRVDVESPAQERVDLRAEISTYAVLPEVLPANHLAEIVDGPRVGHSEVDYGSVLPQAGFARAVDRAVHRLDVKAGRADYLTAVVNVHRPTGGVAWKRGERREA